MALSNIFREPVREINETLIGLVALIPFCAADYFLTRFWYHFYAVAAYARDLTIVPFLLCLLFTPTALLVGVIAVALVLLFLYLFIEWVAASVHKLGEAACNALEEQGFCLRPRQRKQGQA